MTVFGDRACEEVIKVKYHKSEALSNRDGGLVRRGRDTETGGKGQGTTFKRIT